MDQTLPRVTHPIRAAGDLTNVRAALRDQVQAAGLGIVAETKFITAGSELARNILRHTSGGSFTVELCRAAGRNGVEAVFSDDGPGIDDLDLALQDGYSTGGSLGIGLPGAKRLVDEFAIESRPGGPTTVTIVMWTRA
jgi:serine/threonine-protein kinase RsbT